MKTPSRTKGPAGTRARTSRDQNTKRGFVLGKLNPDQQIGASDDQDRAVADRGDQNGPDVVRFQVAAQLRALLQREDTPAAAKVNAARTLAEIEGMIGRHQLAPIAGTTAPLSSLSRDQLTAELDRLRTLFDLGLVT